MEMNKLCSCIVPCFNEEKVIPIYYDEMQKVMKQEENIEFEIIFVDDGSKDGTLEIVSRILQYIIFHFPEILEKKLLYMQG